MKPIISKEPDTPQFTETRVKDLTTIVFGERKELKNCDALFVFSGTHPGHWEKAIEAYQRGLCKKVIVTGGKSLTGVPHPNWGCETLNEADVIISHLLDGGVPFDKIIKENKSSNSLENVLFAKEIFDFSSLRSLMFICKSHAAGRQERTLRKHLGEHLEFIPFSFAAEYKGIKIERETWSESETGRSRVWGEFLRILTYGERGDIASL
ncbi:YdcF family protein [Rossellomorea vietnamensis]|uniref:YdcF family protein n=1 Tax=Rossellomorea vietnamensis TaxID=218284 RepID=A0A5D4MH13_9BACI|nr:YdcF family protein [Rossellomorea vietnamensis]TYS00301.1 YdcF family protein [Rossellomorea vietnamensis]